MPDVDLRAQLIMLGLLNSPDGKVTPPGVPPLVPPPGIWPDAAMEVPSTSRLFGGTVPPAPELGGTDRGDTVRRRRCLDTLYGLAAWQYGYFTMSQAKEAGCSQESLAAHLRAGRLERVARGLYRFRAFPTWPRWRAYGALLHAGARAMISHDTALALHASRDQRRREQSDAHAVRSAGHGNDIPVEPE
jgi:hypothetical protein